METDLAAERAVLRCIYHHPRVGDIQKRIVTQEFQEKFPGEPIENLTDGALAEEERELGEDEAEMVIDIAPDSLYQGLMNAMDRDEEL